MLFEVSSLILLEFIQIIFLVFSNFLEKFFRNFWEFLQNFSWKFHRHFFLNLLNLIMFAKHKNEKFFYSDLIETSSLIKRIGIWIGQFFKNFLQQVLSEIYVSLPSETSFAISVGTYFGNLVGKSSGNCCGNENLWKYRDEIIRQYISFHSFCI